MTNHTVYGQQHPSKASVLGGDNIIADLASDQEWEGCGNVDDGNGNDNINGNAPYEK